jgi:hypothetical protein
VSTTEVPALRRASDTFQRGRPATCSHRLQLQTPAGLHDIRTGNAPDARLLKFIGQNLLAVAGDARSRFEEYKDLLAAFVADDTAYEEFAARVRRRERGLNEDSDWEEGDPADWE